MIWHITKRELYDNLNSLRFALTTILLLALMLTNAVVYLWEHPLQTQKYHDAARNALNTLRSRTDLYDLSQKGPGKLHKKPSSLRFCAAGGETFLSDVIDGNYWVYTDDLKGIWKLAYPSATPNLKNVRPDVTKLDWGFIIGYVLSLIALLFTFDSVSGEHERGTLRLTLANSVPRHTVLTGKFLGALISINIAFTLAVLVNLLMISTSNDVHLSAGEWGRLGIIFFVALLYTCLFLALGLLVSTRVQQSAVSLVILLLMWVTFVVFMPSTLAAIANGFSSPTSYDQLRKYHNQVSSELSDKYETWIWADEPSYERMQRISEFIIKDAQQDEHLNGKYLALQFAQVQRVRSITRISPATILQHLLESFAGTGFERHLQFVENSQRYARQFREFVVDTDRADPESLHLIGVREGMSEKPVSPEAVPKFEDTLSLSKDFNAAAVDLLLLTLFVIVLLSGAYLAFVRVEV